MEITSLNNPLVKDIVKLQHRKKNTNKILLEGYKVIYEAFASGIDIDCVFVTAEKAEEYDFVSDKIILTTRAVLKKISTTETAPEAVGVGIKRQFDKDILKTSQRVLLLENIKDPGNLGTILRTAAAFNVDAIILYGGDSVDLYNPKTIRSSVGNLWKIPVFEVREITELNSLFENFTRIATLPRSKNYLKDYQVKFPCLVMFGSEAEGLSEELVDFSTDDLKIEMSEDVESLNLSVSCAVVLYKLFL